ncbi:DUF58 domain-containing protein [Kaarinaea lacus]
MWAKFHKTLEPLNLERFFQGEGPHPSPLTLVQRRVFILPTKLGVAFAVLLFVMLVGSINYSNSLGFMLTFLLASLNVISILHCYRNLLHLQVSVKNIRPVYCDDKAHIPVLLDNTGQQARYSLQLAFPNNASVKCDIPADGWTTVELPKHCENRGLHNIGRFTLSTVFPLGMFRAWSHLRFDVNHLVYPKPAKATPLPQDSAYRPKHSGDKGRGSDDFAGLRNYHVGDSLRHVHWKTVAKDQDLHTKQFGGDRNDELWLDWRRLESLSVEQRLSLLCRWIIDAETEGLSYGLWLPSNEITPSHGENHKHRCLKALALYP